MDFALLDYVLPLNLGFRLIIIPHFVLDIDCLIVYVLPRNGQSHQKEKRQPPVLLPGRKRSRRRQTSHRSSGLSRHRRKSRRTHRAKGRPGSPLRHVTRLRSSRRLVAGGPTVRLVATAGIPVACSAFRTRSRSLSPARGHPPHL